MNRQDFGLILRRWREARNLDIANADFKSTVDDRLPEKYQRGELSPTVESLHLLLLLYGRRWSDVVVLLAEILLPSLVSTGAPNARH